MLYKQHKCINNKVVSLSTEVINTSSYEFHCVSVTAIKYVYNI